LKQQQEAILVAYVDGLRQEYEILEQKQQELHTEYDHQFQVATDLSSQALQLATFGGRLQAHAGSVRYF